MNNWSGTTRSSPGNLAEVVDFDAKLIAVVATGDVVPDLRERIADETLTANTPPRGSGDYAILERGPVHTFVRCSENAYIVLRDEDGTLEVLNAQDLRMYQHEAAEAAMLMVGVPPERLEQRLLDKWLGRGPRDAEVDKLVAAWGDYGVAIINGWGDAVSTPFDEAGDTDTGLVPTIPPPALISDTPFPANLEYDVRNTELAKSVEPPEERQAAPEPPQEPTPEPPSERPMLWVMVGVLGMLGLVSIAVMLAMAAG